MIKRIKTCISEYFSSKQEEFGRGGGGGAYSDEVSLHIFLHIFFPDFIKLSSQGPNFKSLLAMQTMSIPTNKIFLF